MAKITFTKLGLQRKDAETTIVSLSEEVSFEVKKYLPVKDKLELLTTVINKALDSSGKYYNPAQLEVLLMMEIVYNYTNISFTEKQKEDYCKCYDLLLSNGVLDILEKELEVEVFTLRMWCESCLKNIYQYNNSLMGMLENAQSQHDNLNLDAEEIRSKFADPENLAFLKEIAPLLNLA